jgi:hypothetical protein
MLRQTYTYSILEISKESFEDIKKRLEAANCLDHYLDTDRKGRELLIMGTVAFRIEEHA